MKPILILPVGNIGSGKSTLAKKYAKKGYIVISRDSFRYQIGAGEYIFDKSLESYIARSALNTLEIFMESKRNIFSDETNVSSITRKKYIDLAKSYGYQVIAVVLPKISQEEAVNRRCKDKHGKFTRRTWNKVWLMFDSVYKKPNLKEGFKKIINLTRSM